MDTDTSEAIETLRGDIRSGDASLRSEIGQLRDDMFSMRNELKRHAAALIESLHDDIRIIAEGVVSLDVKVQSLGTKVQSLDIKVEFMDTKFELLLPPDHLR